MMHFDLYWCDSFGPSPKGERRNDLKRDLGSGLDKLEEKAMNGDELLMTPLDLMAMAHLDGARKLALQGKSDLLPDIEKEFDAYRDLISVNGAPDEAKIKDIRELYKICFSLERFKNLPSDGPQLDP